MFKNNIPPLNSQLPPMDFGNMARDGGNFMFSETEKNQLITRDIFAKNFIRTVVGAEEFIQNKKRYCLWIEDSDFNKNLDDYEIIERINFVRETRLRSSNPSTKKFAETPHRFAEIRHQNGSSIFVPSVSSERRNYIPVGFLDDNSIIIAPNFAIYDPEDWVFAVISSHMHMVWVRAVAGRLETRYRYSSTLCYNTFPFPSLNDEQKKDLTRHVDNVLDTRDAYPERTIAQLYDPDKMPADLLQAHKDMDRAVELCFRPTPFRSDTERLSYLFERYEKMIAKKHK